MAVVAPSGPDRLGSRTLLCRSIYRRLGRHGLHDAVAGRLSVFHGPGSQSFYLRQSALYELSHALFNVQPEKAYLIFKYAVVAQAPLAVIAVWILARDLSPVGAYSDAGRVVRCFLACLCPLRRPGDDGRAVSFTAGGRIDRSLARNATRTCLAGAAGRRAFGLGVNLRETIGFYVPWLVFAPFVWAGSFGAGKFCWSLFLVCFFLCALGWFGFGLSPTSTIAPFGMVGANRCDRNLRAIRLRAKPAAVPYIFLY